MARLIEIFRAGRHRTMSGETIEFSQADIDQIVRDYDASKYKAPFVVGHPKTDDPAFGYAEGIVQKGPTILAFADDIAPSLAEGVRKKHFRNISASFFKPRSPANPTPGRYYLRHIGVLGAVPPAVTGLQPLEFAADDDVLIFAEGDGESAAAAGAGAAGFSAEQIAALHEMIKAAIAAATAPASPATEGSGPGLTETDSAEHADATDVIAAVEKVEGLTPEQLLALKKHIAEAFTETQSETDASSAPAAGSGSSDTADHALSDRARRLDEREAAQRAKDRTERIDALVKGGIVTPGVRKSVLDFTAYLDGDGESDVCFAPGDERSRGQIFVEDLLAKLGPRIPLGPAVSDRTDAEFADDESDTPEAWSQRARVHQAEMAKKGIHVTTQQAVEAVKKGR